MPKLTIQVPKYRLHRASGQAVVTINGRDVYLGKYGTPESVERYHRATAEWQLRRSIPEAVPEFVVEDLVVSELFVRYWEFAAQHYRKGGRPTSEVDCIRLAMRDLVALYGRQPASGFGPLALKTVRESMVRRGLSRGVVNQHIGRIKRMFKWAVSNELVPPSTLQGLQAVTGLRRGRCNARETDPVRPVPMDLVEGVLQVVTPPVGAMIRLQLLTGMRPGEVVIMRPRDISIDEEMWVYTPESHKTEHHGHARRVLLGPRAQEVMRPFLDRDPDAYLFSPAESEAERRREVHAGRRTPISCGNRPGSNRRARKVRQPGDRYDVAAYRRAIAYGCKKAFPPPQGLVGDGLRQWNERHRWHPHQLRHNAATQIAREHGIEAARVVLGHQTLAVTDVYAERDLATAAEIMRRVG